MLLPREKPFLSGLNSYYLDTEKFIQHLQGEIGTGCLYGKGAGQELLVYFDESEIVRGVTQKSGEHALVSDHLDHVMAALVNRNFQITIYYLDPDSIFFWGQMPVFKRAREPLASSRVSLPDLIFRLNKKKFSGFIEVDVQGRSDCAVLFFYQGQRRGGSYYWGRGGLSPSDDDYNTLLSMLQKSSGIYRLGYFTSDPITVDSKRPTSEERQGVQEDAQDEIETQTTADLNRAVNEFMEIFLQTVRPKTTEPLIELKLKFIDFVSIYPVLDPYSYTCCLEEDGTVVFADSTSIRDGTEGIIDCAWMVVEEHKLHKKFRTALQKMASRNILAEQGIDLEH